MAFPSVATLLDDFNRADSVPLDGTWATLNGLNALDLSANAVRGGTTAADNGSYWTGAGFGSADVEFYVSIATLSTSANNGIFARLTGPGSAGWTGYMVQALQVSGATNDTLQLFNVTSGYATKTSLGTGAQNYTLAANDLIGIRCQGTTIEAWYAPAGVWNATPEISVTNSAHTAAGSVGIYLRSNTWRYGNAWGGVMATTPSLVVPSLAQTYHYTRR